MELDTIQAGGPRIAIYSQDGFGLGHMRRTSTIAWQIVQLRPDAAILTLSDSQLGQFFRISPNHDYLKLPSIVKHGPGNWKATNLPLAFPEVLEMRRQLIRSALLSFAPDIFLVDHMPHGAMGELIPGLEALQQFSKPIQVILGLRDILDAPEVTTQRWKVEGAFEAVERYYTRLLVYGMREVFDVAEKYHFPPAAARLVRYTGYVSPTGEPTGAAKARARFLSGMPPGTRLVVAMAGGGADAYPTMSAILEALPALGKHVPAVLALITGPFMPAEQVENLQKRARRAPVRLMESVDDTYSLVSAADLVISMAGYNSSVEILRAKKPAILIPRAGPSAEQRTRSRLFAAQGWVSMIDPDELTPGVLAAEMAARMSRTVDIPVCSRPNLHGGAIAANQILSLLAPEWEREPALVG